MGANAQNSFAYLRELNVQYRAKAEPVPIGHAVEEWWAGLLIQIGDCPMVCQQNLITEVISLPNYGFLPSARPWVLGVANLRGDPLPLIDTSLFFNTSRRETRHRRVLVSQNEGQSLGLVVDGVNGMQRILVNEEMQAQDCPIKACQPFAQQAIKLRRKQHWYLDLQKVLQDDNFRSVARQTTRVRNT